MSAPATDMGTPPSYPCRIGMSGKALHGPGAAAEAAGIEPGAEPPKSPEDKDSEE